MGKKTGKNKARAPHMMQKKKRQQLSFKRAYLTKGQAARRLQISGAEFERLSILKGIFPREPRRFEGASGKDKTYFFTKDISWLEREPILQKMREYSTFRKKLTRLRGRRQEFDAKKFEETHLPSYSLDKVIKERYPTFGDALRDIDDALTHVFLYAALPPLVHSDSTIEGHRYLTSGMSDRCRALRDQWVDYVTGTNAVRRAFISIKGIYYQASVKGEVVTWQCPYEFTFKAPKDVVHRTLISFLEFYIQLLRFVLFKLEGDRRKQAQKEEEDGENADGVEDFPQAAEEKKRNERLKRHLSIFKGLTFYVSRECHQVHMGIAIRSFGGVVTTAADDAALTHYIVDRPALAGGAKPRAGVEYLQPQWLFDSINAKARLPVDEYWMGKSLPPHVSPFRISISNDPDEVAALKQASAEDRRILTDDVPDRVHEIRRMLDPTYSAANPTAAIHLSDGEGDDDDEDADREAAEHAVAESDAEAEESGEGGDSDSEKVKEQVERSRASKRKLAAALEEGDNKSKGKARAMRLRAKLEEQRKARVSGTDEDRKRRKIEAEQRNEEAMKEMRVAVAPRKNQKLYGAMQHGIKRRSKQLQQLEERRNLIRAGGAKLKRMKKGLGQGQGTLDIGS